MRFRRRRTEPAGPCGHPDAWTPEAIIYSGRKITYLEVTCMECGWQGRVPPDSLQEELPR